MKALKPAFKNNYFTVPTPRQLEFQSWEFGIFLHFGIRTFYEGHQDWDGKPMDPKQFTPSALDCGNWAGTAAEAGARYMVLTAKHHDGFANWPSAYTDFSVASSPWKGGRGDVVGEFVQACRDHGLKPGLYYSPADASCPVYEDAKAYDDYFINQISEILTGYGDIDLLWFDGCGSEGHEYDWPRIMGEIRRMQPNILIFNMGDPDYRWVGNEAGLAPLPCWNTVQEVDFSIQTEEKEALTKGLAWLPAECDLRMRERNWFFSDQDAHTVKSVPELMGIYQYSVGRGCNMLLNIGPDRRGLLPDPDRDALLAFGRELQRRYAAPFSSLSDFTRAGNTWALEREESALIDTVVLQEDLSQGEHVRRFRISVAPHMSRHPVVVYEGYNIGHKAICRFPLIRAQGVNVEITEADGKADLTEIAACCTE